MKKMIDQTVLLQIDATIIAGVLILLTIGHFRNEQYFQNRTPLSYRFATAIILPFGFSAMSILVISFMIIPDKVDIFSTYNIPTWTSFIGFLYLIIFMSVLSFKKVTKSGFDFEIKNSYWFSPEKQFSSVFYTVIINILLKNTSEHDTVINTVNISFTYEGKYHSVNFYDHHEIEMKAGDSKIQTFGFNLNENQIRITKDIKNIKLKIEHTYDSVERTIPNIKQLTRATN